MANLTIAIDDQLLQAALIKALQQGTSVNEICREAIARFAGQPLDADEFMARWRELARHVKPSPTGEPIWPGREALYEEMLAHRNRGGVQAATTDAPPPGPAPKARRKG